MYPRSETDPADFAERFEQDPQAELEAIRQREWDGFVALLLEQLHTRTVLMVVSDLADAHGLDGAGDGGPWLLAWQNEAVHFASQYGWPSVFRALAQALEADQAARQELDRRR